MTDTVSTHCQMCGRHIQAGRGIIAHHGYTRPGQGWQTGSCAGALHLPYEASCEALKAHVASLALALAEKRLELAAVEAETKGFGVAYDDYSKPTTRYGRPKVFVEVTRATFDAAVAEHPHLLRHRPGRRFDDFKASAVRARQAEIKSREDYQAYCEMRIEAWAHTANFVPAKGIWEPAVVLSGVSQ